MIKLVVLTTCGCVLVAFFLIVGTRNNSSKQSSVPADFGDETATAAGEVRLARERTPNVRLPAIESSAAEPSRAGSRLSSLEEEAAQSKVTHQRTMKKLEDKFASESHDLRRRVEMQNSIAEYMATGVVLGSTLQSVDCRTSICKVSFAHESGTAQDEALAKLFLSAPFADFRTIYFGREGDEGARQTVLYVSQPHGSLPLASAE